jgi:cobalt/nickel transport protein
MRAWTGLVLLGLACAAPARAHYHMLLPSTASAKKDQEVTLTFQFGHPFEHQLFDARLPRTLLVVSPDGKKEDLKDKLQKIEVAGDKGKKVTAYRLKYKPAARGDYIFLVVTEPVWMADDKDFIQDTVKVILHVQAEKNWDFDTGRLEFIPLTRPYGLTAGMVFQAEILDHTIISASHPVRTNPLAGATVEVERYNATPPAKLPPEEQITRTLKLDRLGKAVTTLPEAGWWAVTMTSPFGRKHKDKDHEGKVRYRSTLWVFVDEAARK